MDVTAAPSEEELNQLLKETSTCSFRENYITVNDYTLPERYRKFEKSIREYEVYDSDLWITGFPKTGTTWISEIAWLILNDFDYEGAKKEDYTRVRMMEFTMLFDPGKEVLFDDTTRELELDSIKYSKSQKSPRSIKTHFPFPLLPEQLRNGVKKPRIIYTARNPIDTCISYYHQCKNFEGFTGSLEDFCKLFLFDKVNYGPYHKHVLSFWERREMPNFLFLTYEEMHKDLAGVIKKVAKLLGKDVTSAQIERLAKYVSFDSMKKNSAVNKQKVIQKVEAEGTKVTPFIRSGKVGGYKHVLSPELIAQFKYLMEKRFQGSGLNLFDDNL